MTEVLVTHAYLLRLDPKQWKAQMPYAPLATLYATAVLREAGIQVAFHDMMFATGAHELEPALQKSQPKLLFICDDGFNYLTKMCLTNMREACFAMVKLAKEKGCKVIVSSSDATDHSLDYLNAGADYVLVGEVEQSILELCKNLLGQHKPIQEIAGLRYLNLQEFAETGKRENLRDLDKLPLPAWDMLNFAPYLKAWKDSKGYFSVNVATTRGCPYKCNWCAKPIYGNRYNARSAANVVKELVWLKQLTAFNHVWFCDDIFGLKPGWLKEFNTEVHKHNLKFLYKIQSRVDLLLNDGSGDKEESGIQYLAQSGCEEVWVGAESGSQKILDAMDKGTKVQQIEKATQLMKTHGIKPCFFLQFGYLGEDNTDIKKTIDMVFRLMPHDIGISVSYPLPGTGFYEKVKSQLGQKQNWTHSDELAVMFQSTYPNAFYRRLQRYVHHRFRLAQSLNRLKQGKLHYLPMSLVRAAQTASSFLLIKKYAA